MLEKFHVKTSIFIKPINMIFEIQKIEGNYININNHSIHLKKAFAERLEEEIITIDVLSKLMGFDVTWYSQTAHYELKKEYDLTMEIGHIYHLTDGREQVTAFYYLEFNISKFSNLISIRFVDYKAKYQCIGKWNEDLFVPIEELKNRL